MKEYIRHLISQMGGGGGGGGGGAGSSGTGDGGGGDGGSGNGNGDDICGKPHKKCSVRSNKSYCDKPKGHKGKHKCCACGEEF
jgi:hypothetical protein